MGIEIPLTWNDSFMTGVDRIDQQHRVLVNTLNEAHARLGETPNRDLLNDITRDLLSYALYHFETEESLMQASGYREAHPEDEGRHHAEHRAFSKTVVDLRNGIKDGHLVGREELIGFLSNWLVNHILNTDKKLGAFLVEHGHG
jgi:hemerythrin-like metal-binding protein